MKAESDAYFVRESIEDVNTTMVIGGLLTVFIVYLFLNSWRSTIITGITLPISVVERAELLLEDLFTVETNLDVELQVKIALREKFVVARVKQAILMVATAQLIRELAQAWSVRRSAVPLPRAARATVASR